MNFDSPPIDRAAAFGEQSIRLAAFHQGDSSLVARVEPVRQFPYRCPFTPVESPQVKQKQVLQRRNSRIERCGLAESLESRQSEAEFGESRILLLADQAGERTRVRTNIQCRDILRNRFRCPQRAGSLRESKRSTPCGKTPHGLRHRSGKLRRPALPPAPADRLALRIDGLYRTGLAGRKCGDEGTLDVQPCIDRVRPLGRRGGGDLDAE